MRLIPFFVVDSFTEEPFQGNPAGVFLDAETLTADEMRRLAGEVHLESAFVLPGDGDHDLRLRYFTGVMEVPLCGHATLAAVTVLVQSGRIAPDASLRIAINPGSIGADCVSGENGRLFVTQRQQAPEFGEPLPPGEVALALGCAPEAIAETGLPVQRVSTGTPWLYAPVSSREVVDNAPASFEAITDLSRRYSAYGIYVFSLETDAATGAVSVWSRSFAPIAGLNEDPVTGSASGALGGYLWKNGVLPPSGGHIATQQGFAGGRGGTVRIEVQASREGVKQVAVTGTATLLSEGAFTLP